MYRIAFYGQAMQAARIIIANADAAATCDLTTGIHRARSSDNIIFDQTDPSAAIGRFGYADLISGYASGYPRIDISRVISNVVGDPAGIRSCYGDSLTVVSEGISVARTRRGPDVSIHTARAGRCVQVRVFGPLQCQPNSAVRAE